MDHVVCLRTLAGSAGRDIIHAKAKPYIARSIMMKTTRTTSVQTGDVRFKSTGLATRESRVGSVPAMVNDDSESPLARVNDMAAVAANLSSRLLVACC